ncbi:uncharacterized protein G2W53_010151 [Senna tora]|uniref:Uncharacterized protein n=1 Tax=Senna tora TaxID=362788 RepID=A0A835CDQ7_9FABA|nr:uncharacterized protein G2W53_010151 [Senna tora]
MASIPIQVPALWKAATAQVVAPASAPTIVTTKAMIKGKEDRVGVAMEG